MAIQPSLTIIQSTHASLDGLDSMGLLERHCRLLSEYAKFFHVTVYSSDLKDYSSRLGVKHRPIPWLPGISGLSHLFYYLWLVWQSTRMQGIIKVFGSNIPTLPIIKFLSGGPMVVTYQWDYATQTRKNEPSGLKKWIAPVLERLAITSADVVFVTADWLDDKVQREYRKKTMLLPNWVDFKFQKHVKMDTDREKETILFSGRLHWSKGANILIDSFVKVKRNYPEAKLVICGSGDEEKILRNQVDSLGVLDVEFLGILPNYLMIELMQSVAVFVLPTLTMEGHPKSLIEAMACGAACVGTDVPGINNIIVHEDTGLLVPPSDVNALSNALQRLLGDSVFRSFLGRSAEIYAEQFDFRQIVTQEIEVLKTLRANFVR